MPPCRVVVCSASSGEATCDLSGEEDSPLQYRVVARRAKNGGTSFAGIYGSLGGGFNRDTGVSRHQVLASDSGGQVKDESGKGVYQVKQTGTEQGLCGPYGLLSVPKVKPLLLLVCIVQVRLDYWQTRR